MTNILFDLVDVLSEVEPGDTVRIWPPRVTRNPEGQTVVTRPENINVGAGPVTRDISPGPLWVQIQAGGYTDTEPKLVRVPEAGESPDAVTIANLLGRVEHYDPVLESWAYENAGRAEQAALEAIAARDRSESEADLSQDAAAVSVAAAIGAADATSAKADRDEVTAKVIRNKTGSLDIETVSGTAWAHTTESGDRLPLGYAPDGTLDRHAREAFADQTMGVRRTNDDDEYAHVLTTDTGHLLMGIRRDGGFNLPGLRAAPPRDFARNDDGQWVPVFSDTSIMTVWGSSTPQRITPFLQDAFRGLPVRVSGMAKGGEWVEHTAARMGVVPATITPVTIPAEGAVAIDFSPFPPDHVDYAMLPYSATIAGVHGTVDPSGEYPIFTRSTPGEAVTLDAPTEIIPDDGPLTREHVTLLGVGKNNLTQDANSAARVIDYTDRMIDWLTPKYPRFIIFGHHPNPGWGRDTAARVRMDEVNNYWRENYGPMFFDVQAVYTAPDVWDKTGITPTPEDLAEVKIGNKPPSLSRDASHFNNAGHELIAYALRDHITGIGWY